MKSNICIIPARGGSKRIPRKNLRNFLGFPIISYSIKAALASKLFSKVIVSTDDNEIADVAKKYGAEVPFLRSTENSDDHATLSDVVDEVVAKLPDYKYGCCLLPTAPLLQANHLKMGYDLLKNNYFDSVRPVVRFSYPIQRALKVHEDGSVVWYNEEYALSRSQDLEDCYHDAGMYYWFRMECGLKSKRKGAVILDSLEVQDIDTLEDWKLAELKYKFRNDGA